MPLGIQDTITVVVAVYEVRVLVLVVVSQYSRNFPSLKTMTIKHDHSFSEIYNFFMPKHNLDTSEK